ncbi:MAG: DUF4743 domain-containing protein, partial [Rhodospirillales bacterium]
MSYLDRIAEANNWSRDGYRPLLVDGLELGQTSDDFAAVLEKYPDVFVIRPDAVRLADSLSSYDERSKAIGGCLEDIRRTRGIHGWRGENYPVGVTFSQPLFEIERAAVPL